jgi:cytochrome c oxidase subunit 2
MSIYFKLMNLFTDVAISAGGSKAPTDSYTQYTQSTAPKIDMSLWDRMKPPEDISMHGHLIDWLFAYTTYLNIFFFTLVCIGLFGFSYLYSKKRHPKAEYTYGNRKAQVIVATVIGTLVFFAIDLNITRISNNDYTQVFVNWPNEEKEDVFKVQVLAQQWAWNFRYAGEDGIFNTEDDVVTLNDLRLPTGKKIVFQILSKDVIHSFFLPNVRTKVDAIPGRITRMWTELKKDGVFDIACAEMCGTYHYRMQARMTVYNPEDFDRWYAEAKQKAVQENPTDNPDMYWGWQWQYPKAADASN